jgi:hypothetical protein
VKVDEDILESRVDGDIVDNCVLMDALELGGNHCGAQSFGYDFTYNKQAHRARGVRIGGLLC